jgi:hypothetical protein
LYRKLSLRDCSRSVRKKKRGGMNLMKSIF